ncbi:hypothetical protein EMCRGX_G004424 [Ephydatia muelleri]
MESFNHQLLLTYLPKRIHFHTNTFKMRMNLAVMDWNENTQQASTSHGEYLDVRRLDHHSTYNVLKKKNLSILLGLANDDNKSLYNSSSFEEEDDAIDELMSPDDSTLLDGDCKHTKQGKQLKHVKMWLEIASESGPGVAILNTL